MSRDRSREIAVTGLSARFPGDRDMERWWTAVQAGQVLTTRLDRRYLTATGVPEGTVDDPSYVPVHGFLPHAEHFENELFGISVREAELMDPQHRLMIETAWAALEDAGRDPSVDRLRTAVFASSSESGYVQRMLSGGPLAADVLDRVAIGAGRDFMASRIAYKLGLRGPAVGVLTGCSSSLTAVHMAIQALRGGDCDQAVVVAASVDYPQAGHGHVPGGIISATGTCRPFDAAADGSIGGSGVAAVVLRRLDDAIADGDCPHGVILGSAINNDGSAKAGFNAPSAQGQEEVIRAALNAAGVPADSIGYVEAHGTGTFIGDPIEWRAASAALGGLGAPPGQIAVGAVKANIGHLDAAAGLASLIKGLLVVRDGIVPPVAGFTRINPLLQYEGSPLYVPTACGPWHGPSPRRAGVSSFGIGGTNVHVVIEQPVGPSATPPARSRPADRATIVALSAASPAALSKISDRLCAQLNRGGDNLPDVAYTLAVGRAALASRLAAVGRTTAEITERLASRTGVTGSCPVGGPSPLVYLLPDQGAQAPGMAQPFIAQLTGFEAALEECLAAMGDGPAAELRSALLDPSFPADRLDRGELAQPALFALEYAIMRALRDVGLAPAALAGYCLGEITSACAAGVIDLPAAARLVLARAEFMQACPASHAFRTAHIGSAVSALRQELSHVPARRPSVPFLANRAGTMVPAGADVDLAMFVESGCGPVRFAEGLAAIARQMPGALAIEVGPGRTLTGLAAEAGLMAIPLLPSAAAGMAFPAVTSPGEEVALALGELWARGQPVNLAALLEPGRRVHLPTYPFAGPRLVAAEAEARTTSPGPLPQARPHRDAGVQQPPSACQPAGLATVPQDGMAGRAVMTALWNELLGYGDLTDDADFADLGGDSLILIQLGRRLSERYGVAIPIRELMAAGTLGRQVAIVERVVAGQMPTGEHAGQETGISH